VAALNAAFTAAVITPSREAMASGPSVYFHESFFQIFFFVYWIFNLEKNSDHYSIYVELAT
jgi:hypothetical protein